MDAQSGVSAAKVWLLTAMGAVALVLVVVNISLTLSNSDLRAQVNERQKFINQSIQLSQLHNQLVRGLATLAARSNDQQLREVLEQQGISFTLGDKSAVGQGRGE